MNKDGKLGYNSMMVKVLQNHYNPKSYLEGFSGEKGYLCRYQKSEDKIVESTYTSFGSKRHLYTDYFEKEVTVPIDNGFLHIRDKLSKCFIDGESLEFNEQDFRKLAEFVALQAFRTPVSWDIFVQAWSEYPSLSGVSSIEILKEKFNDYMLKFAKKMYPRLQQSHLMLCIAPNDCRFITSNNVVTQYRTTDKLFTGYTQAYLDESTQILFPINARLCLWSGDYLEKPVSEIELKSWNMERTNINFVNSLIFANCVQYVYSGSLDVLNKAALEGKKLPKCSIPTEML